MHFTVRFGILIKTLSVVPRTQNFTSVLAIRSDLPGKLIRPFSPIFKPISSWLLTCFSVSARIHQLLYDACDNSLPPTGQYTESMLIARWGRFISVITGISELASLSLECEQYRLLGIFWTFSGLTRSIIWQS